MKKRKSLVTFKILVIGDSGVGKTNLIKRYCDGGYLDNYVATIGLDFKMKQIHIGDQDYRLQIWDTAGQQRFKNITNAFYKGAHGVIIAFSLTDPVSFSNVEKWVKQINSNVECDVVKIVVGTKADLEDQRKISKLKGIQMANQFNLSYIETSSKTSINVDFTFVTLGKKIQEIQEHFRLIRPTKTIKLIRDNTEEIIQKSKCYC